MLLFIIWKRTPTFGLISDQFSEIRMKVAPLESSDCWRYYRPSVGDSNPQLGNNVLRRHMLCYFDPNASG